MNRAMPLPVLFALALLIAGLRPASAQDQCPTCTCAAQEHAQTQGEIREQDEETKQFFGSALPIDGSPPNPPVADQAGPILGRGMMGYDETWMYNTWFRGYVVPAMQLMTEQLVTLMMNMVFTVGTQLDAAQQLQTQRLLQQLTADAHRDYRPDPGICTYGTNIRSLAQAARNSTLTAHVASQHALQRQLGAGKVSGAEGLEGLDGDRNDRLKNFAENFCDYDDNDRLDKQTMSGLYMICQKRPDDLLQLNLDVDYVRAVADPDTIALDMNDADSNKPNAVLSLEKNLFGSEIMPRISGSLAQGDAAVDRIVDVRSVAAKRSVAESSFDAILGMKSMGTKAGAGTGQGSADTLKTIGIAIKDLGVPDAEVAKLLGDRPSYYAQLKFLAKRLYQRPEFYVDLYTSPANVERKRVAMQAINSILEHEIYNSSLRREAILSQIVELQTTERARKLQDTMNGQNGKRQAGGT